MTSPHRRNGSKNATFTQGYSGVVPPILLDEKRIPKFYRDAIAMCGVTNINQYPNTAQVYNLMVTSQLPKKILGNIWALVNRTIPGKLTHQKGETLSDLCDVSSLPIPFFQSFTANTFKIPAKKLAALNGVAETQKIDSKMPKLKQRIDEIQNGGKRPRTLEPKTHEPVTDSNDPPVDPLEQWNSSLIVPSSSNAANNNTISDDFMDFENDKSEQLTEFEIRERISVWKNCLTHAQAIFKESIQILFNPNVSQEIRTEILATERGSIYFHGIANIFGIIRRIYETVLADFLTYNFDPIFLDELETFRQKWNILLGEYFMDLKLLPKISSHQFETKVKQQNTTKICSICLNPESLNNAEQETDDSLTYVELLNSLYHTDCANFYLNRVGILLPKLC